MYLINVEWYNFEGGGYPALKQCGPIIKVL